MVQNKVFSGQKYEKNCKLKSFARHSERQKPFLRLFARLSDVPPYNSNTCLPIKKTHPPGCSAVPLAPPLPIRIGRVSQCAGDRRPVSGRRGRTHGQDSQQFAAVFSPERRLASRRLVSPSSVSASSGERIPSASRRPIVLRSLPSSMPTARRVIARR